MGQNGITIFQMFMIMIASVGLMNHVIFLPLLVQTSMRDSWITVLVTMILFLWFVPVISYIIKSCNQRHLFHWTNTYFGRWISLILAFLASIYLFFISWITVQDSITWTIVTYLPQTPRWILVSFLLLICFYNASNGIRSIAATAEILLPVVIFLGFLVGILNMPQKDFSLLKPLLEQGYSPILKGLVYGGTAVIQLMLIFFLQHHVQSQIRIRILFLLYFFLFLLTLGPIIGAISEFGPIEAAKFRYPGYEQWRLVQLGRYIEHLDFFSIYQWLTGAFIQVSLMIFLIPDLFNLKSGVKRNWLLVFLFGLLFILSNMPISDASFLKILKQFLPLVFLLLSFLLVILFLLSLLYKKKGEAL